MTMPPVDSVNETVPTLPAPRRKRSFMRGVIKALTVVVGLVVVGVVVLYFMRNGLVRAGVERGGRYATNRATTLEMADLGVFNGSLSLNTLHIANDTQNYKEPQLLAMKSCDVSVQPSSLLTPTVAVETIKIDGLEIWLEQNGGKNNLGDLVEELKKNTPATGDSANTSPGKKLKITSVKITHIKVHLRAKPLVDYDLDLGDIVMDDPMNPDGRPMKIADLVGKVLMHVAQQLLDDPRLPAQLRDGMKNVQATVDHLKTNLDKDLKGVKALQNVKNLDDLNKALPDAQKGLKDLGKDLQNGGKGFQDMLKGKPPASVPGK